MDRKPPGKNRGRRDDMRLLVKTDLLGGATGGALISCLDWM